MTQTSLSELLTAGGQAVVRTLTASPGTPAVIPPDYSRTLLVFLNANGGCTIFPDSQTISDLVGIPIEAYGPSTGQFRLPLVIDLQTWRQATTLGWTVTSTGTTQITIIQCFDRTASKRKPREYRKIACRIR